VNVSQQVSLRDAQFSENRATLIVILAGEFVAKRLPTLSSIGGKSRRSQFIDGKRCDRVAHNIGHALLSTGNKEARLLIQ